MALAISDLSYDLITLVRTYDRANDFERAEEYRALLDRITEQERIMDTLYDALYDVRTRTDKALQEIDGLTLTADHADRLAVLMHEIAAIVQHAEESA